VAPGGLIESAASMSGIQPETTGEAGLTWLTNRVLQALPRASG
jgi:hypothetical protein